MGGTNALHKAVTASTLTEPNDFLRSKIDHLPPGRILCLAEGEGRNAVFLAERLTESRPGRPASIYAASP